MAFSQKGRKKLQRDGNLYNHNKQWTTAEGDHHLWVCEQRRNCHATVTTDDNDNVIRQSAALHTHGPSGNRAAVLNTLHRLRNDAHTGLDIAPAAIINENVPPAIAGQLPAVANLKRAIRYARNKSYPHEPASADDVLLQHEWALTKSGEHWEFPVHVDGQNAIIFTTQTNVRILSEAEQWFADGAFRCCPRQFRQVYTIHGMYDGRVLPLVYILMSRKHYATLSITPPVSTT